MSLADGLYGLLKSGVKLDGMRGNPLYSAHYTNPDLVVRKLCGKSTVGSFIDGEFVEIDANKSVSNNKGNLCNPSSARFP